MRNKVRKEMEKILIGKEQVLTKVLAAIIDRIYKSRTISSPTFMIVFTFPPSTSSPTINPIRRSSYLCCYVQNVDNENYKLEMKKVPHKKGDKDTISPAYSTNPSPNPAAPSRL